MERQEFASDRTTVRKILYVYPYFHIEAVVRGGQTGLGWDLVFLLHSTSSLCPEGTGSHSFCHTGL